MSYDRIARLVTTALLGLSGGAAAQVTGTLDMGAGTYRPDRAIPGGIASIAPALEYRAGPLLVGAAGVYSDAPAGRWNLQATSFTQLRSPKLGIFGAEAGGQVDITRHFGVKGSTAATGELRLLAYPFRGASVWFGRAIGVATALDRRRPLRRSRIGTSARVGGVDLSLSISSTSFDLMTTGLPQPGDDTLRTVLPETASRSPARRSALTDALLSSSWRIADFNMDVTVGRRFSRDATEMTIWGVSASRGISPNLAVVAGAGRSGSDPVTSVPGARYVVAGLRLRVGPSRAPVLGPLPPAPDHAPVLIGPVLPSGREIRVRAPGAERVELAGDFTDWRPVELERADAGAWRAVLAITPGLHRLAIRVDRGEWHAPPGSRAVRNEFGGEVAEVVVE
jgi:hypothetical protein